jgi:DNA-binding NarL/FixJ family response regulator
MVAPAEKDKIRIIIIDDHPVALAGMRVGLKRFEDIVLAGEALDGATGLRQIEELKPDIAVVDVLLPDMDGLEVTARARQLHPAVRIILTSGDLSIATMSRAAHLGVAGYFHKSGAVERLALLVRSVFHSELNAPSPLGVPDMPDELEALTLKEHEMLMLLANGASLKQAAGRMGITYKAADRLKQSVMRKLDVHNRVELVRYAIREHLVQDPK